MKITVSPPRKMRLLANLHTVLYMRFQLSIKNNEIFINKQPVNEGPGTNKYKVILSEYTVQPLTLTLKPEVLTLLILALNTFHVQ